jgi:hypothetical protein
MLPVITDCKTVSEVRAQNKEIQRMATDLVALPIVQEGYLKSGQAPATAYINVNSMARKRLHAMFPSACWDDPLFERLMVEARYICAECIKLKYECRDRRTPYDHLKDATIRIKKMVRDSFIKYEDTIKKLECAK